MLANELLNSLHKVVLSGTDNCAGGAFPFTLGRIEHGFNVRPDLCAVENDIGPRKYLGKFYTDTLVHDPRALRLLVDVIGKVFLLLPSYLLFFVTVVVREAFSFCAFFFLFVFCSFCICAITVFFCTEWNQAFKQCFMLFVFCF